jgi:hypothetical protein
VSAIIKPNASVLFMKIGIHAREPLDEIIQRKLKEIDDAGVSFWGYGGSTCHPTSMVQPFAQEQAQLNRPIYLVMQKMESNHWAEPVPADEYSVNGRDWLAVPKGVEVRGSRYALVIDDLEEADLQLPLARAEVALGPSQGRSAKDYIAGRVDKACLTLANNVDFPLAPDEPATPIGLVAKLKAPYAVFLRNK